MNLMVTVPDLEPLKPRPLVVRVEGDSMSASAVLVLKNSINQKTKV